MSRSPIPELRTATRASLDELCGVVGPDSLARQRMWQAIEEGIWTDPGPDGEPGSGQPDGGVGSGAEAGGTLGHAAAPSELVFAAKVVGATVGMVGAGLLGLRLAVLATRALVSPDAAVDAAPAVSVAAPEVRSSAGAVESPPIEHGAAAQPSSDAPPMDGEARGGDEVGNHRTTTKREPGSTRTVPRDLDEPMDDAGDELGAEIGLLGEARSASTPAQALAALGRHRQEFPEGQLASERELLRVKALCQLERRTEAETVAHALRRSWRVEVSRILELCPGLDLDERIIEPAGTTSR